ncbi:MAG: hypothetical protein EPO26_15730 [Chloroflexota bacterium]|nr:MAG: hypothetical protein EPO26_15730 [Chloroflexota bacterium]
MRDSRWARLLGVAIIVLVALAASASLTSAQVSDATTATSVYVYVGQPPEPRSGPRQVVVALHGIGGEGRGFCQSYLRAADRNGWIIVAPTVAYRDWHDPAIVAEDDLTLMATLARAIDRLPAETGLAIDPAVTLIGFSRGAQVAHRFSFAYPERTRAVVALSAGTYTLPRDRAGDGQDLGPLRFPFGISDLAARVGRVTDGRGLSRIGYWIAVGERDNRPDDVPRQWDALIGKTRVQRARAFATALRAAGARPEISVFPDVDHVVAPEMVRGAIQFMERMTAAQRFVIGPRGLFVR